MTNVVRCDGIGGSWTETQRGVPGIVFAVALTAAFGVLGAGGGRSASAQQPAPCQPTELYGLELYGPEGGLLEGASGEQDLQLRACVPGTILLEQGPVPYLLLAPLNPQTNSDWGFIRIFTVRLCGLDGGSDLPGAKLTVSFQSDARPANTSRMLTLAPDKDKPTLKTTSTPSKGTKVKPGDTINVRMEASEEYNSTRYGWQTGVKKIQLTDESRNQVVPPLWEAAGDPRSCAQKQWKQTLDITYTVPSNPPPIIRLRAIAEDFAGNKDDDLGEFPTGDWYGSLKFSWEGVVRGVKTTMTDHMDIVLDYDGQGNLTGSLVGNRSFNVQDHPDCNWAITIPNKLRGKLVGSYTPGADVMSIQLIEPEVAPAPRKNCPGGGYIYSGDSLHEEANFKSALRSPRAAGDGRFQSDITWMTGPIKSSVSLRLQRAQN